MKRVRKALSILLAVSLLTMLAACGNSGQPSGSASGNNETAKASLEKFGFTSITEKDLNGEGLYQFDFPLVLWSDPVYIADAEGFFAKNGLKINFVGSLATNDIVTTVASGQIPFGCMHANAISIGVSKDYPIKAIAAGWGTNAEKPMIQILVKPDSEIKKVEDLNGHTVAVTDPTQSYWMECKDKYGLNKVEERYMNLDEMEVALLTGQVDAIYTNNPYPEKLLKEGKARSIITAVDIVGPEKGWPQQFVNKDFMEKHPDIVRAYVASLAEACDWARENPKQAGVDVAKALSIPEDDGDLYNPVFPEHALIDEDNAQLWIKLAGKFGFLAKNVETKDVYTNEFNPYYKK